MPKGAVKLGAPKTKMCECCGKQSAHPLYANGRLCENCWVDLKIGIGNWHTVYLESIGASSEIKELSEEELFSRPISELDLSARAINRLENNDIETIGDLVEKTGEAVLMGTRGLGPGTLAEIKNKLAAIGLKLQGD